MSRTGCARCDLYLAGALEHVELEERLRERGPPGEEAMVAQYHRLFIADARNQALAFTIAHGSPLELMVGNAAVDLISIEIVRRQALGEACHCDSGRCVRMHDAVGFFDRPMQGGVNDEPGTVHRPARTAHGSAIKIDEDKAGGRDFPGVQAERIDENQTLRTGHAKRSFVQLRSYKST